MKRLLSVILLLAMLASCIVTYGEEGEQVTRPDVRRMELLSALGMAGVFAEADPLAPITRGEFAALTAGLIGADRYPKSETAWFTDVPADHLYFDDITAAAAYGIISGYADGTFRPDEGISYEETVTVVMKALGYGVAAELEGGWHMGYMTTAAQVGMTKGVSPKNTASLSYTEGARLICNALDCPLFRTVSYGDLVSYEADEDRTPLTEYHDIYYTEGYVNATFLSALVGYTPTANTKIRIGSGTYEVERNAYAQYLGYYVEAYYRDEDTGVKEIVYLAPEEATEQLVIRAEDITSFSDLTYHYDKKSKAEVDVSHSLIVNGKRLTDYDESAFVPANGEITLLTRDGRTYDTVIISTFHNYTLQRAAKGGGATATFTEKDTLRSFAVDMAREDLLFELYMDGERFALKEFTYETTTDNFFADEDFEETPVTLHTTYTFPVIPEGAVASVFADEYETVNGFTAPAEDAKYVRVWISTDYVEGAADELSEEEIVIGGEAYKIAAENSFANSRQPFGIGAKGRFVKDYDGRIAAWIPDIYAEDGYRYGYLINAIKTGSSLSNDAAAKLMRTDGDIIELSFAKKPILNGRAVKSADELLGGLRDSAKMIDPAFTISQLIKYKLNEEGELKDIQTVLQPVGLPEGADKDHLNRDRERSRLSQEYNMLHIYGGTAEYPNQARIYAPNIYAVHFVVPPTETFNEDDYWIQDTWRVNFSQQSWMNDGWKYADVFDCSEFREPGAVVIYETPADNPVLQSYVMVEKVTTALSEDGTEISVLRGYDGWGPVAYYSEELDMFEDVEQGDFVRLYGVSEKIARCEMVISLDAVKSCDLDTIPEDLGNGVFEVYSKNISKNMVLQRGPITKDGKREFQRASFFRGGGGPTAGFNSGPLYYGDGDKPVFSYFYSGVRDSFSDIKTVIEYGNEDATRVYVREDPGMRAIVIYDFAL